MKILRCTVFGGACNTEVVSRTWIASKCGSDMWEELARYDVFGWRFDMKGRNWGHPAELGVRITAQYEGESVADVLTTLEKIEATKSANCGPSFGLF
jgi:hypothetical protein